MLKNLKGFGGYLKEQNAPYYMAMNAGIRGVPAAGVGAAAGGLYGAMSDDTSFLKGMGVGALTAVGASTAHSVGAVTRATYQEFTKAVNPIKSTLSK